MTTAARPTWNAAVGGSGFRDDKSLPPTRQFGARDVASHTKLKLRQPGQNTRQELEKKDLKRLLFQKETGKASGDSVLRGSLDDELEDGVIRKKRILAQEDRDIDEEEEDSEVDDSEEEEEDDDTEELLRELEKIKREREQEKQSLEDLEQQEKAKMVASTNPLLGGSSGSLLKKKWYDDVIFKNQAKGLEERPKKRFINDLIRSDFHRKFMDKYVK